MFAFKARLSLSSDVERLSEELKSVDEATISRELDGTSYALSLASETLNALRSPLLSLPDDTLMEISKYCAFQEKSGSRTYLFQRLVFTFVCRRWRSVAIDTPACWADVSNIPPRHINMFLERSKAAPVSMVSFGRRSDSVYSHLWHVESLTLLLPHRDR